MNNQSDFRSFHDYWQAYLREHRNPTSRALHYLGITAGLGAGSALLLCGQIFFLPLGIVVASATAWLGHHFEHRATHITAESPLWAVVADLKMFALFVTGRLGRELEALSSPRASSSPS